ncbi:hypothetical protein [Candidatus Venteria ishoeyi]|uniref:DUF3149 domain-containing protein n=1 Tax=Candidatus Venteria ishoeyi TaxID=1899563 RepID=A0A1H6FE42_9GAMM|nr:hypothetical protein [Candidatus Venteria ishoeyi]MDM8545847.1 hypothetical protein [Candidatus Venteria ishoeyi]SEH08307.1 Uncharacterised protein [Candidatus Venteria ishoeyi]
MPILDILLKDPIGQLSLFTIGFSTLVVVVLTIFFIIRSGKKDDTE